MSSSAQSVLKHIIIIKQVMKKNENNYNDEVVKMIEICDGTKGDKRIKEMVTCLYKRMKEQEENKSKDNAEISIFVCINQNNKQANCYNESFIMACLLYLFIRFKFIRVNFNVKAYIPKPRKQDLQIKISLTQQFDLKLTQYFYSQIAELMRQIHFQIRQASAHFQQIKFKCESQSIDSQKTNKKIELLKLREDTYQFIYQFYENLSEIFMNKKMFVAVNHIQFFCQKENLQALHNSQMAVYGQELYVKKILKIHELVYINTLVVKVQTQKLIQDFHQEEIGEEKMEALEEEQEDPQYQQNLGYFSQFHGNQFQFLSKILLIFSNPSELTSIKNILPRIPNINTLKIHKQNQQIVLPQINEIMRILVIHNKLIEIFWLQKIRVQHIQHQQLQILYQECPYLSEFQINVRFRYLIQQTYAFSSPEEKQIKQNQRQCQIILNALRLRKITLDHNLDMAKVLIKKKYNFNQIIQVIDCIQPFCF